MFLKVYRKFQFKKVSYNYKKSFEALTLQKFNSFVDIKKIILNNFKFLSSKIFLKLFLLNYLIINNFEIQKHKMLFTKMFFTKLINKSKTKKIYVSITLKKRNIFFNFKKNNKLVYRVTIREAGYLGFRKRQYTSVFNTMRTIKNKLYKYFKRQKKTIILCLKGPRKKNGNLYAAIFNCIKAGGLKILYIRYRTMISHSGCRAPVQKVRKKRKTYF